MTTGCHADDILYGENSSHREARVGDIVFERLTITRDGNHWKRARITGETKQLWVLDNGDRPNKKTMITAADRQGHKTRYYTYDGVEAKNFCDQYARGIASAVSVCDDPVKLRAIAALIGKELPA